MSQGGRGHKPEATKKGAGESVDPTYVLGESSPLSDPMRGVRAERQQAAAQISRTLRIWRKADAGAAPEEDEEKKQDHAEDAGEEAKGGEGKQDEAKGEEAGKEEAPPVAAKLQPGASKIFLADDGTPKNNQAQNKQFDDAVRAIEKQLGTKLSKDQRRQLHDAITGQNMGFQEIVQEGLSLFGR